MNKKRKKYPAAWRDAEAIVQRLLSTTDSCNTVARGYGCSGATIGAIYRAHSTRRQRLAARRVKLSFILQGRPVKAGGWNKGTGIPPNHNVRWKKGERVAGQKIHPIGSKRMRRGRWFIKVADVMAKDSPTDWLNWKPLARVVWEKHHGPIPSGYSVCHKGDKLNDDISNLVLLMKNGRRAATVPAKVRAKTNLQEFLRSLDDQTSSRDQRRRYTEQGRAVA